jgi:hypothetical protein
MIMIYNYKLYIYEKVNYKKSGIRLENLPDSRPDSGFGKFPDRIRFRIRPKIRNPEIIRKIQISGFGLRIRQNPARIRSGAGPYKKWGASGEREGGSGGMRRRAAAASQPARSKYTYVPPPPFLHAINLWLTD